MADRIPTDPIPTDPLPQAPGAFARAFQRAWQARSGRAIAALFAEDGDFVNVTGLWWQGRDRIGPPHDYALSSFFAQTDLRIGRHSLRMLGEDHAIVRFRATLTGQTAPDGTPADPRRTILTFVLQRTPAGWQALSGQNTEVIDGHETWVSVDGTPRPVDYRRH